MTDNETNKQFRIANQAIFLTYSQCEHFRKDEVRAHFELNICGDTYTLLFFRVAHEKHENGGTHNHILVKFNKNFQTRDVRKFDYLGVHPNIEKVNPKRADWDRLCNYMGKEDAENGDLVKKDPFTMALEAETTIDAIRSVGRGFSDVMGIIALRGLDGGYDFRTNINITLRPWQETLLQRIAERDDRAIYWVIDRVGGKGKTTFGNWLSRHEPNSWVQCQSASLPDAMMYFLARLRSGNEWNGKGVIIDLPRQDDGREYLYRSLESIKNGILVSSRYQGINVQIDPPILIVFANWPPLTNQLSQDRWRIIDLDV